MFDNTKDIKMAEKIASAVKEKGGAAYYVGGFVRDRLMGRECKDIDIEVHGLAPDKLSDVLDSLGERLSVGESFGIYGMRGYSLDIAMPRKENLKGRGHRDFDVTVDPFIGEKKAAMRRDFTINALMQNVLTGEVLDFFGGLDDIKNGILRHVSDKSFAEDSLRVLRGAQFSARFGFEIADETMALFRQMSLDALSRERVEGELEKAMLGSAKPSVFFECLKKADRLCEWFPELFALIGVEQNKKYHAEGDAFTHTMLVLDAAAKRRGEASDPFGFMLAALVHDFGKAVTTECIDGVIHSYGHEKAGQALTLEFMHRLTGNVKRTKYVMNLALLHMKPNVCASSGASIKATNKMFDEAICPKDLILLSSADAEGKQSEHVKRDNEEFLFGRLRIYREYMARPCVSGKDLVLAGISPGPVFSEALAYAHKLHLAGIEKEQALKQTLSYAAKLSAKL